MSGNRAASIRQRLLNRARQEQVPFDDLRTIDAGSVALSMGPSYEVHCRSYPWASESGAATAFARALAGQEKRLSMTVAG